VIGQQVSVAGARTVAGRLVGAVGAPLAFADELTHVFPDPERLATAADACFPMPVARRETLRRLADAVGSGTVRLDPGVAVDEARSALMALRGIGPWTADYVAMRGLGDPDRFLGSDLGVRHALVALDLDVSAAERWAPWRSYAVHHLWASLSPAEGTRSEENG
jgi:AraC family transcriptional regulator of adaptative response / DNA-3-methyladenine glycosylase II